MEACEDVSIATVTIAALYHGEISEGCAYDILHWRRDRIRMERDKFSPLLADKAAPDIMAERDRLHAINAELVAALERIAAMDPNGMTSYSTCARAALLKSGTGGAA